MRFRLNHPNELTFHTITFSDETVIISRLENQLLGDFPVWSAEYRGALYVFSKQLYYKNEQSYILPVVYSEQDNTHVHLYYCTQYDVVHVLTWLETNTLVYDGFQSALESAGRIIDKAEGK